MGERCKPAACCTDKAACSTSKKARQQGAQGQASLVFYFSLSLSLHTTPSRPTVPTYRPLAGLGSHKLAWATGREGAARPPCRAGQDRRTHGPTRVLSSTKPQELTLRLRDRGRKEIGSPDCLLRRFNLGRSLFTIPDFSRSSGEGELCVWPDHHHLERRQVSKVSSHAARHSSFLLCSFVCLLACLSWSLPSLVSLGISSNTKERETSRTSVWL